MASFALHPTLNSEHTPSDILLSQSLFDLSSSTSFLSEELFIDSKEITSKEHGIPGAALRYPMGEQCTIIATVPTYIC